MSPSADRIAKAVAHVQRLLARRCAVIANPSSLGYLACPSPCPGTISDYTSLGDCYGCLAERWMQTSLDGTYGTQAPVPLDDDASRCQAAVGKAMSNYLTARMRDQQICQFADDRAPIGDDCRVTDYTGARAPALYRANRLIDRCSDTILAGLDSCATTVNNERTCIQGLSEASADALFIAIYRPGELFATPTSTATSTPLPPTPSASPTETVTSTPSPTSSRTVTASATAVPTGTPTRSATPTRTRTFTPVPPSATASPTDTLTAIPTATDTDTETPVPTDTQTPIPTATSTALPPIHVDVTPFPAQTTPPCLIFVHGKRTDTGTYTDWSQARAYWQNGSDDFVRAATKNFATPYYVVGYNGTQAYWDTQSAGEVAAEIINATNGGSDGGGNHCALTFAQGGTFWVIGHSMGGSVIDFILGNADPSDPNYNSNGAYDVVAARVSLAITSAGTHRGSQGADFVCGEGNPFCSFFAQFLQSCDAATFWLRSSDDVQVRLFAGPPAKTIWLTGGYAAIIGASSCLSGEDDGVVQHASAYACDGSATTGYNNDNLCGNNAKQESSGFKNLDTAHENHDQERNDSHSDNRVAIPDGVWICNGTPCAPGTTVQNSKSTAAFIATLY